MNTVIKQLAMKIPSIRKIYTERESLRSEVLSRDIQIEQLRSALEQTQEKAATLSDLYAQGKQETVVRSKEEFLRYMEAFHLVIGDSLEKNLAKKCSDNPNGACHVLGFCEVCGKPVNFWLDLMHSINGWPAWTERMECPECDYTSRLRYMVSTVITDFGSSPRVHFEEGTPSYPAPIKIYMYERVTKLYSTIESHFGADHVTGSEYLSPELASGTIVDGILHEDAECLSFEDNSFDLIISCDVFEHVADYKKSFREAARVLKPGGKMYMTVPFFWSQDETIQLAAIVDGKIVHYFEPEWHGNPLSNEGSLCFWHHGWAILDDLKHTGFRDVFIRLYHSRICGYMANSFVFVAEK